VSSSMETTFPSDGTAWDISDATRFHQGECSARTGMRPVSLFGGSPRVLTTDQVNSQ
jgi:hypothetical protein